MPKAVRQIAAPIILMVLVFYFYIEGPLIFGTLWTSSNFGEFFIAYLFMIFGSLILAGLPQSVPFNARHLLKPVSAPLWLQLLVYAGITLGLNAAMYLSGLRVTLGPVTSDILRLVLLQITVSGAEELFFRGALFKAGPIISSVIFAAFHAFVYQLSIFPLIISGIAGFGFYYMYAYTKDQYGLAVNTGAHLAYNTALLGIFLLGYIGGCVLFLGAC